MIKGGKYRELFENYKVRVSGGDNCVAINCHNNRGNCRLSLFRFPRDPERCRRWVLNTRREDLLKKGSIHLNRVYTLCSEHFEDCQFMNRNEKRRLVWNAIPTLFDIPNPPKKLNSESDKSIRAKIRFSKTTSSPQETLKKQKIDAIPNNPEQNSQTTKTKSESVVVTPDLWINSPSPEKKRSRVFV